MVPHDSSLKFALKAWHSSSLRRSEMLSCGSLRVGLRFLSPPNEQLLLSTPLSEGAGSLRTQEHHAHVRELKSRYLYC